MAPKRRISDSGRQALWTCGPCHDGAIELRLSTNQTTIRYRSCSAHANQCHAELAKDAGAMIAVAVRRRERAGAALRLIDTEGTR